MARGSGNFTLIELLIVVAIIAIISSMFQSNLWPTFWEDLRVLIGF